MSGEPGFTQINHNGKPVQPEGFKAESYQAVPFAHMYRVSGFKLFPGDPEPTQTHACLTMGYWCWGNAKERPRDVLTYLMRPVRRLWYRLKLVEFKFVKHFVNHERHRYFGGFALFYNYESVQDFCHEYSIGLFWPQRIATGDVVRLKGLTWRKLVDRER